MEAESRWTNICLSYCTGLKCEYLIYIVVYVVRWRASLWPINSLQYTTECYSIMIEETWMLIWVENKFLLQSTPWMQVGVVISCDDWHMNQGFDLTLNFYVAYPMIITWHIVGSFENFVSIFMCAAACFNVCLWIFRCQAYEVLPAYGWSCNITQMTLNLAFFVLDLYYVGWNHCGRVQLEFLHFNN